MYANDELGRDTPVSASHEGPLQDLNKKHRTNANFPLIIEASVPTKHENDISRLM